MLAWLGALIAGGLWRLGFPPAGRWLVQALVHGSEQTSTLAGMLLVKAGERSVHLVDRQLRSGVNHPKLVSVLSSLASPGAESVLSRLATAEGPLSAAAHRSLDDLRKIRAAGW